MLHRRSPGGPRVWSFPLEFGLVVSMVVLASCLVGQTRGQVYPAEGFPDPLKNPYGCNSPRGEPSLICDPSNFLTEFQHGELEVILKSIRERGTCPCTDEYSCDTSYTVTIAIVPAISTSGGLTEARSSLREFAKKLQTSEWQHGSCGENAVIVYSVADNIIETSFGIQARAKLQDECRDEIQGRVDSYLRNKQIFEGISLIVRDYSQYFNGEKTCNLPTASSPLEGVYVALIFMCIIIAFGLTYFFIVSFKKCTKDQMLRNMHTHPHPHGPKVHIGPAAQPNFHISPAYHGQTGPAVVPGQHPGGAMGTGQQGTVFSLPYGRSDGFGGSVNVDAMDFGGNSVSNITVGGDDGAW